MNETQLPCSYLSSPLHLSLPSSVTGLHPITASVFSTTVIIITTGTEFLGENQSSVSPSESKSHPSVTSRRPARGRESEPYNKINGVYHRNNNDNGKMTTIITKFHHFNVVDSSAVPSVPGYIISDFVTSQNENQQQEGKKIIEVYLGRWGHERVSPVTHGRCRRRSTSTSSTSDCLLKHPLSKELFSQCPSSTCRTSSSSSSTS